MKKTALMVVVWHAPDPSCGLCLGEGVYIDDADGTDYDCPCCEDTYREPTVDEVRAWLAEGSSPVPGPRAVGQW